MRNKNFIFILFILTIYFLTNQIINGKVCESIGIRNNIHQFKKLDDCQVIEGNLIIALLHYTTKEQFKNITFPNLVEITDYLVIYQVNGLQSLGKLFPNLAVIRGQQLFDDYSVYVSDVVDLQEINLNKLQLIENGIVGFANNPELCYTSTIDWYRITNHHGSEFENNKFECNVCNNETCPKTGSEIKDLTKVTNNYLCWSENECQRVCDSKCNRTCFLENPSKCCPHQCYGSCFYQNLTSEQIKDNFLPNKTVQLINNNKTAVVCTVCRKFELNGQCYNSCPSGYYEFKNRRCITKKECILRSKIYVNSNTDSGTLNSNKKPILLKAVDRDNDTSICVEECPNGYMVNPENDHSCVKCGDKCFQQCDGGRIESLESSNKFKKCTNVNGDLIISLQESGLMINDLEKKLIENLGYIETITGYLRITKSFSLKTLHFFKNLREIGGQTLDRKDYSLLVIDNANLEELFLFDESRPNIEQLKISKGKIFFQLNPKLCINKVYELQTFTNIRHIDEKDVPDFSNGDKAICKVEKLNIFLKNATSNNLLIEWTPLVIDDFRTLLGYDIWYKKSEFRNISSKFENRDACNQNEWKFVDHDVVESSSDRNQSKNESELISHLDPATQYAFYIKANVLINPSKVSNENSTRTGISDIHYFTTKPSQPNKVEQIKIQALSDTEIEVSWVPPTKPNGKLEYYSIQIEKNNDLEIVYNDCEDKPSKTINLNIDQSEKMKEDDKNTVIDGKQCCQCGVKKPGEEKIIESRAKKIRVENLLHNTIYSRSGSNKVLNLSDSYLSNLTSNELSLYLNLTKFKEQLDFSKLTANQRSVIDNLNKNSSDNTRQNQMRLSDFKLFNLSLDQIKEIGLNVTNLAKIGLNEKQLEKFDLTKTELNLYTYYNQHFKNLTIENESDFRNYLRKFKRKRSINTQSQQQDQQDESDFRSYLRKFVRKRSIITQSQQKNLQEDKFVRVYNISSNTTQLKIGNLTHFTHYIVKVRACLNISEELLKSSEQCSFPNIQTIQTKIKPGADNIDESTVEIIQANDTEKSNILHVKWNKPISPNGAIKFFKIELTNDRLPSFNTPQCVILKDYYNFSNGYKFYDLPFGKYSLRLKAITAGGQSTWTKPKFVVVPDLNKSQPLWVIIIISAVAIAIFSSFILFSLNYYNNKKNPVYASNNPDYVTYDPDEWEICREHVLFETTDEYLLGKGNWGTVYKGLYKDPTKNEPIKVAIKTNNAEKREDRCAFLNEASTMKQINCNHIIRLIGVVSKGIPVLVLMELMEKGDLKRYLLNCRPKNLGKTTNIGDFNENNDEDNYKIIGLRQCVIWALQIADGMAYLEKRKFVHRDLASRNCLLAPDLTIKISDFGMARDIYSKEYYKRYERAQLPVRWCAPESIRDGVFTTQSDVWGYGVVLYEIFTLGSRPYYGKTNEEVADFITKENGKLKLPDICPEIFRVIMQKCWNSDPNLRPSFIEIIEMLLPEMDNLEDQNKFKRESFFYNQSDEDEPKKITEELESNSSSTTSNSKKGLKKEKYLNDRKVIKDDGSNEGLLKNLNDLHGNDFNDFKDLNDDDNLRVNSLQFTQLNNLDTNFFNDLQSKKSESYSENDSSKTNSTEKFDFKFMNSTKKEDDVVVEMSLCDKETESNNRKNIQKLNQQLKKNRQESVSLSCQSSSNSSNTSNDENNIDLIQSTTNSKQQIPISGNLPNGNILLNS